MKTIYIKRKYLLSYVFLCTMVAIFHLVSIVIESETVVTNTTPITNKIVILDAGHGLPDERY